VLSVELTQLVQEILDHEPEGVQSGSSWEQVDFYARARIGRLHAVLREARAWDLQLGVSSSARLLGEAMTTTLTALVHQFSPPQAGKLVRLMTVCKDLQVKPQLWKLQTCYFHFVQKLVANRDLADQIQTQVGFLEQMDTFLDCRFQELLNRNPQ
jgi:hypothetical protein